MWVDIATGGHTPQSDTNTGRRDRRVGGQQKNPTLIPDVGVGALADNRKICRQRGTLRLRLYCSPFEIQGDIMNSEVICFKKNFLHLTGIKTTRNITSSTDFFEKLLLRQINCKDIIVEKKDMVERKLSVLPYLMSICSNAKMVGEYDSSRPLLRTEVLAGGVRACIGFVKGNGEYYVPNTVLKEDLRNITKSPQQRVLVVFRKDISQDKYQEVCKIAKGVSLDEIKFTDELKKKLF